MIYYFNFSVFMMPSRPREIHEGTSDMGTLPPYSPPYATSAQEGISSFYTTVHTAGQMSQPQVLYSYFSISPNVGFSSKLMSGYFLSTLY